MNRHLRQIRCHSACTTRGGWTLAEVMVSTLLVGVLIVPTIGVFIRTANNYYRESVRDRAWQLGQELMDEIMTRGWEDPTASGRTFGRESDESPANRLGWDDIDDYDGLVDLPPTDESGIPVPDSGLYERRVSVQYVRADGSEDKIRLATDAIRLTDRIAVADVFTPVSNPRPFKLITVTVQGPVGPQVTIAALRYRNGIGEQLPLARTQSILQIGMDADGTTPGVSGRNSINLFNRFPGTGGR